MLFTCPKCGAEGQVGTTPNAALAIVTAERDALKAAIQAKCAYCRKTWDAGLDDPAFCPTNCPLLPYRGGE